MGVVVNRINNIQIEKSKKEVCCRKTYPNGTIRLIKKKEITHYKALSPKGNTLYENDEYQKVKKYALGCKNFLNISVENLQ